jgi:hypothetical protein
VKSVCPFVLLRLAIALSAILRFAPLA